MKTCIKCKIKKEETEFNKSSRRKDGLQCECRVCQNNTAKNYYNANKTVLIDKATSRRVERLNMTRQKYFDYLKTCSCVDCGFSNPAVLDFDHRNPNEKIYEVSKMVRDGYSWENILKEINKCDVRCANCHRLKTAKDQEWYNNLI